MFPVIVVVCVGAALPNPVHPSVSAADRAEYVRLTQRTAQLCADARRAQERAAAALARSHALLASIKALQKEAEARKAADQGKPGGRRADD